MKIALAQMNSLVGDISSNEKKIIKYIEQAKKNKAQLLIFPELALNGYSPLDLINRKFFLKKTALSIQKIYKQIPANISVLLGGISPGTPPEISMLLLQKDKKAKIFSKEKFANYDVFDESRYFKKGDKNSNFFTFQKMLIHVLICEEMWHEPDLNINQKHKKPELIISCNASPFGVNKSEKRKKIATKWAKKYQCPIIYLNSVGGQEELIFDGGSFILDKTGHLIYQSDFFKETLDFFELSSKNLTRKRKPFTQRKNDPSSEKIKALCFGLKEFVQKNRFKQVHLGLSGGVDSALVAALACKALGRKKVKLFFLPGPFTSKLSEKCAYQITNQLQCSLAIQTIEDLYRDFLKHSSSHLLKHKSSIQNKDLTKQNIQARLRSLFLMAYANNHPESLLLGTSNKSEIALGYGTLYGDLAGGLLPLGDLFKTEVYALAALMKIPSSILKRKASAELSENQTDEEDLLPYKILDPILEKLIEKEQDPTTDLEKKIFEEIIKSEFKRRQTPPILKIKNRSFDKGWRIPFFPGKILFSNPLTTTKISNEIKSTKNQSKRES